MHQIDVGVTLRVGGVAGRHFSKRSIENQLHKTGSRQI